MSRKRQYFAWFAIPVLLFLGGFPGLAAVQNGPNIRWMVPGVATPVSAWAANPDSGRWAVATEDGSVKWGLLSEERFSTWHVPEGFITALAWKPEGGPLLAGDNRGVLHEIHPQTAASIGKSVLDEVSLLAIHARTDGSFIVGTAAPHAYWIPFEGEPKAFGHHEGGVTAIREKIEEGVIQLTSREGAISRWTVEDGTLVPNENLLQNPDITSSEDAESESVVPTEAFLGNLTGRTWIKGRPLAWGRDFTGQQRVLLTSAPSWLQVNPNTGRLELWEFPQTGHPGGIASLIQGTLLADGSETLWIKDGFDEVKTTHFGIRAGVDRVISASNGRVLVISGGEQNDTLSGFRLKAGHWESTMIPELPAGIRGSVISMGLSADGRYLLIATLTSPAFAAWCELSDPDPQWSLIALPGIARMITPHPFKARFALTFSDSQYQGFGEVELPSGLLLFDEEREGPLAISYSPVDGHLLIGGTEALEIRQGQDVLGRIGRRSSQCKRHILFARWSDHPPGTFRWKPYCDRNPVFSELDSDLDSAMKSACYSD
jgi:hypothetical protein